ncbi:MAG: phospholipase domain-containing protein, partial [Stenotrophomonas sp.]
LPYRPQAEIAPGADTTTVQLTLGCEGAAAVLHVYDRLRLEAIPRRYTVAPGAPLQDQWPIHAGEGYDLWLLGPNGFHRQFRGDADAAAPVQASVSGEGEQLKLQLNNTTNTAQAVTLRAAVYAGRMPQRELQLAPGQALEIRWNAAPTAGWYDLEVLQPGGMQRLAGRIEDGRPGSTDPALGTGAMRFLLD